MNKYTKLYADNLQKYAIDLVAIGESIGNYRPFSPNDAFTKGIPTGAGLGALLGGGYAAFSPDEYDERTGRKKSKLKKILLDSITGAAIGGGVAAASPTLLRGASGALGDLAVQANKELWKKNKKVSPSLMRVATVLKLLSSPVSETVRVKDFNRIEKR